MLRRGKETGHLRVALRGLTRQLLAYGLRSRMNPELDALKQRSEKYSTHLPLVSKTPENAGCEKRNRRDAHNRGTCWRIKHISCAQTDNGGQHPDQTGGNGHAFGCA